MVYLLPGMQEKNIGCNIIRTAMQMWKSAARPRQQNEGGKNVTGKARELDIGKEKRFEKMWNKMQENP